MNNRPVQSVAVVSLMFAMGCSGVKKEHEMPSNVTYEKAAASQESNPLDASTKAQLKRAPASVKAQWEKEAQAAAKEKGN